MAYFQAEVIFSRFNNFITFNHIFLLTLVKIDNKFSSTLGISFIVGGAIGNVLDRIIYGAVVDISLHARGFSWYIFNS